ncbi:MAG: DUF362 domain-containing protein [Acidobacteria bacterium]|nr:DUF362 domain-containing protein [Acidobacteriota bacterium]
MTKPYNRREFLKKSAGLGLFAAAGGPLLAKTPWKTGLPVTAAGPVSTLSMVKGADYGKCTEKAVELLGGMGHFVHKDAKVALLPNVQRWNPGTFTKPEILRAVIQMCQKSGAAEVNVLSWLDMKNWESTGLAAVIQEEGAVLKLIPREEALYKTVPIPYGEGIKDALIMKEFYNNDVFINMPITKDHAGNKFTGTLKNLMGLNFATHNRSNFHQPDWTTDAGAIKHLENCIVDLNTVVKPTLCVVDATEFIITNGPMGPGEIIKPQQVIAGVDRVVIDALCTTFWDIKAADIIQITEAHRRGLGNMNIDQADIKIAEV